MCGDLDAYAVKDAGVFMGEPVWEIDARLPSTGKAMYVTLHYIGIRSPDSINEGDEILVPDHYGSRVRYLIAKKSLMPLQETSWDHAGRLYESYEYPEIILDAGLTDTDFDRDNPAYGF